ncbi:MAG: hypothetical protein GX256_05320 [Fretibacterium sp.]|nr:hypothetical protein [Fretibacterium sp.]
MMKFWKKTGSILAAIGAGCLLSLVVAAPVPAELPEEGEWRALELLQQISRTPDSDVEAREELYLTLVRENSDPLAAQEALWALSELYLDDFEEPREDEAREMLELFLERYPSSHWRFQVKSRLVALYQSSDNPERRAVLCEELLSGELDPLWRLSLLGTCADSWKEAGEGKRAERWYSLIVKEYPSTPEADDARERLKALKKKQ